MRNLSLILGRSFLKKTNTAREYIKYKLEASRLITVKIIR